MNNVSLLYYWLVLYRRRFSIVGITIVAMISAAVLSTVYPGIYEAEAVFFIPQNDTNQGAAFYAATGNTEIQQNALVPPEKDTGLKPYIGYLKSRELAVAVQAEYPSKPLKNFLKNDVDFEVTEETLLRIFSRDRNAQTAADIANSYLKHLNLLVSKLARRSLESNIGVLESNLAALRTKIAESEGKLAGFLQSRNVASFEDEKRALTEAKMKIQTTLDANEVKAMQNTARLTATTQQLEKEGALLKQGTFDFSDPVIESLKTTLNKVGSEIAARNVKLGEHNLELAQLRAQYADTERRLQEEIDRLVSSQVKPANSAFEQLRLQLVTQLVEEAQLNAEREASLRVLDSTALRVAAFVGASPEYTSLSTESQSLRTSYEQLLRSLNETRIQLARQPNFVAVVDAAVPPRTASFPVLPLNVAVAMLVGLAVGIAYAFLTNYADDVDRLSTRALIRSILTRV
jgi:succinoglycan biosynthesis transport protein ExoP